jgi:hypothetical protein
MASEMGDSLSFASGKSNTWILGRKKLEESDARRSIGFLSPFPSAGDHVGRFITPKKPDHDYEYED